MKKLYLTDNGVSDEFELLDVPPKVLRSIKTGKVTSAVRRFARAALNEEVVIVDKRSNGHLKWAVCYKTPDSITIFQRFETSLEADEECGVLNGELGNANSGNLLGSYVVREIVDGKLLEPRDSFHGDCV